ncbi:MAG: preprotein translocase subunit SecE [Deltaproteobacteria bacterium]|jgi:preprotein translocase subunit SecE|nr:preprotein translocase subunit SecE [Deltaproteobacteria bacterium]
MTKHKKSRAEKKELRQKLELAKDDPKATAKLIELSKPKPKPKPKAADIPKGPNKIMQLINFFKEAKKELQWVTWPTRSETIKSTGVLLVLVGISAIYLGLVDGILTRLLGLIIN